MSELENEKDRQSEAAPEKNESKSDWLGYGSRGRFLLFFLVNYLVFSAALATVITIIFFGYRIILHGVPMCVALAQNNLLATMLHNACGCATVEILALLICIPLLIISGPKLFKQAVWLRKLIQK